jgi:predicted signal transduction protein with EAL and GGDEF domain
MCQQTNRQEGIKVSGEERARLRRPRLVDRVQRIEAQAAFGGRVYHLGRRLLSQLLRQILPWPWDVRSTAAVSSINSIEREQGVRRQHDGDGEPQ